MYWIKLFRFCRVYAVRFKLKLHKNGAFPVQVNWSISRCCQYNLINMLSKAVNLDEIFYYVFLGAIVSGIGMGSELTRHYPRGPELFSAGS